MSGIYKHQAQATEKFGITFRSKLEATWAFAFSEMKMHDKPILWDYVDNEWYDFVIHAPWGDAMIEIKPCGPEFVKQAIERMPDGATLMILQGEPRSVGENWAELREHFICALRHGNSASLAKYPSFDICWLEGATHAVRAFPFYDPDVIKIN